MAWVTPFTFECDKCNHLFKPNPYYDDWTCPECKTNYKLENGNKDRN